MGGDEGKANLCCIHYVVQPCPGVIRGHTKLTFLCFIPYEPGQRQHG